MKDLLSAFLKPTAGQARRPRALVAGWFSYPDRNATLGDTSAKDVVCGWLDEARIPFDVAGHPANAVEGVDIASVDPSAYGLFIFVCGPWRPSADVLGRFDHCTKIGIDLTVDGAGNQGFDLLIPRDSLDVRNPDIVFAAPTRLLPVAGIILVHPQPMYRERQRHEQVRQVLHDWLGDGSAAPLWIDTLLAQNAGGLTNPAQLESLVRRTDVVITTRLHGLVFSLRNDVPVIAIDPVAGGAKVTAQAQAIGWPLLINGADLTRERLELAVQRCLDGSMQAEVAACRERAQQAVAILREQLLRGLGHAV